MATLVQQLYSQNHWADIDGVQTIWNFTFSGGYILPAHVKAYYLDADGVRVDVTVTEAMLIGEFQLEVIPAIPATATRFVIYRDTPKDNVLVDFADGARVTALNLDRAAMQAVFCAAEVLDGASVSGLSLDSILSRLAALEASGGGVDPDLGYKMLKKNTYTGSSNVLSVDNGKAHYKTDATSVSVPDTLPDEFLCTIVNDNEDNPMSVSFAPGEAVLQGAPSVAYYTTWALAPMSMLNIWKAKSGLWFISGNATGVA